MHETPYLKGRSDLIGIIRKIPFLQSYSDAQLLEILALSKMRKFAPGDLITREGEYDSWLYIIGEMAIVDGEARSASASAVTETTSLAIDMSVTDRMDAAGREKFDAVYFRLLAKILVNRLRKTTHELLQARENIKELTDAILLQQTGEKR
jgi:CRP-like cAMP-binding protein